MKTIFKIVVPFFIGAVTLFGLFWFYSRYQENSKDPRTLFTEQLSPGNSDVFPHWRDFSQFMPLSVVRYYGKKDGEYAFDVQYNISDMALRSEKTASTAGNEHLILNGCSMIFGVGLPEESTLSSKIRAEKPDINVLNFGLVGGGLHNSLRALELIDLKKLVPQENGTFIYFFTYDHLHRWFATPGFLSWANPNHFHYKWNKSKLTEAVIKDTEEYKRFMAAKKSGLEEVYIRTNFKHMFEPPELREFVAGIGELKKRYKRLFPSGKFLVMIYPFTINHDILDKYLKEAGIDFYNEVPEFSKMCESYGESIEDYRIPLEGHPTAAFNDYFSDVVLRRLGLK